MGFAGLNITYPCKRAVMPLLTELSGGALAVGAVNTVVFDHGRRIGHNTDWCDSMLARGASPNTARKLPVIAGLVGASTIAVANYVQSDRLVIAILSVAFFAQAMSSSGWTLISEVAPRAHLGLVSGLFSASANLSGIVTPLVIGAILEATGSFYGALAFVGSVALTGPFPGSS